MVGVLLAAAPAAEADDRAPTSSGGALIVQPRVQGRLYGGIALIGGGMAAIGIASYVALDARSDYDDAARLCPRHACTTRSAYDATQDARTRANLMTIVGGAGVAMVGVGVWLVLTSKSRPLKLEAVSARPLVAPGALGLAIGGSL